MSALPVVGYLLHCQAHPQWQNVPGQCHRAQACETSALTFSAAPGRQPLASAGAELCQLGVPRGWLWCVCPSAPLGQTPTEHCSGEKGPTPFLWNTSNGSVLRLSSWQGDIRLLESVHSIAYLALWPTENLNFFSKLDPKSLEHQYTNIVIMDRKREFLRRVVSTSLEFLPTHQRHSLTILEIY